MAAERVDALLCHSRPTTSRRDLTLASMHDGGLTKLSIQMLMVLFSAVPGQSQLKG